MWRKNTGLVLLIILPSFALATSCATISREWRQWTSVISSPTGATVSVNGEPQGVTPVNLELARKNRYQVIRIESRGYNPFEIQVRRKAKVSYFLGDVLLGVAAGVLPAAWGAVKRDSEDYFGKMLPVYGVAFAVPLVLIDLASGKGYKMTPKELTVTLTKADGPPRVDTILIDSEDFKNIKWIRVRRD